MNDLQWFSDNLPEIVTWRHDFHAHAEIGFQETRTARKVAELLRSWDIEVHTDIGGTGVVGVLSGREAGDGRIGLRADMDALPMVEKTSVSYRSTDPAAFHGCGHDGHTAILLGAAKRLAERRDFAGTVNLIFQPAEETLRGGLAMIRDSLFIRFPCDEIYALHNHPMLPHGTVGVRPGVILSASDRFEVDIAGIGSHGAMPHKGVDPIAVAAQLVSQLHTIVSRSLDPFDSGVISVGTIHGGTARNVIPERVALTGTIRSVSESGRALLHKRLRQICEGLAQGFAVEIDCRIETDCPPTVNHPEQAAIVERVAKRILGAGEVIADVTPLMASEDFSFMLRERPGAYFFVGQHGPMCHHPEYDFDDSIIPIAGSILLGIVRERLGDRPAA